VGTYAFGYYGERKGKERDAAPNPTEMEVVDRIVALRRDGQSYRQIAAELDLEGHKPRRAAYWSPTAVRNIAVRGEVS
jgi:hypothetical protein